MSGMDRVDMLGWRFCGLGILEGGVCFRFIEELDGLTQKDFEQVGFWGRERINVIGLRHWFLRDYGIDRDARKKR